jgi:hypothetical protein
MEKGTKVSTNISGELIDGITVSDVAKSPVTKNPKRTMVRVKWNDNTESIEDTADLTIAEKEADSVDVRIMKIIPEFPYLVKEGDSITIKELKDRAQFCPGIMDEPELQELVQIAKDSTIKTITRDSLGYWYSY